MRKRLMSRILLVTVLSVLVLTGCGGRKGKATSEGFYSWYPFGEVLQTDYEKEKGTWVESEAKLDVQKVVSSVEITDEMMYGSFLYNSGKGESDSHGRNKHFFESCGWASFKELFGENPPDDYMDRYEYSKVPYAFTAGPNNCYDAACYIPGYNWCELKFASKKKEVTEYSFSDMWEYRVPATYEISGNKIKFHLLTAYDYDSNENTMDYEFSEAYIEYTFERKPLTVLFSNGENTVNMLSKKLCDTEYKYLYAYFTGENFLLDGMQIKNLSFHASNENKKTNCFVDVISDDRSLSLATAACSLKEDGLFKLCFKPRDGETRIYEYVLYDNDRDGYILANENEIIVCRRELDSYYADKYADMKINNLREEDVEKYEKLTEEKKEQIETTRKNLLEDLTKEFSDEGVSVKVDKESGEIVLDSAILFATDKSEVSSDGKVALEKFISSFNTVLQKDEYKDFIDEIRVTGHTDSTGEYDHNVELSKARAESVKDYCLESMEEDAVAKSKFESLLTSEGKASDELVMGEDGNEDKAASRRVVFTFYINLDAIE